MIALARLRMVLATLALPLLAGLARAGESCPAPDACPGGACPGAACGQVCEEVIKKVCVPRVESAKKVTPVYSMKCEDLCLPKCNCFFFRGGHKAGCGDDCGQTCVRCGKPREVRRLAKKFMIEDECKVKCHVEVHKELVPVKHRKCAADCSECVAPAAR